MKLKLSIFSFVCFLLASCGHEYTPKPKAFPRVLFPEKAYKQYSNLSCPYTFEIPVYSFVEQDSTFFGQKTENPCWLNIQFKDFNGTINLTYKEITSKESFQKMLDDAHKLSFKHSKKADYIDESVIRNAQGVSGIVFEAGGEAASNFQFFLTDSSRHFIRGALYFNNEPNADSMAPVYKFVRSDLDRLIATFSWK